MSVSTYTTKKGDVLDYICLKHYGNSASSTVRKVIEFNYWLREYGPVFPPGVEIKLPDIPQTEDDESVSLW